MRKQNRWKSPVLWSSIIALIIYIANNYLGVEEAKFNELINLIMPIIIALGLINNPENKDGI